MHQCDPADCTAGCRHCRPPVPAAEAVARIRAIDRQYRSGDISLSRAVSEIMRVYREGHADA